MLMGLSAIDLVFKIKFYQKNGAKSMHKEIVNFEDSNVNALLETSRQMR